MFASGYTPGGVSGTLQSNGTSSSKKKSKKKDTSALAALFSGAASPSLAPSKKEKSSPSNKTIKRKATSSPETQERNSGESPKKKKKTKKVVEGVTSQNEPSNDVPNIVVFNESGASEDKPKRTRPKRKSKEREKRTVFVGNVPVTAEKKALKKLFKQYGKIESIRFRSAAAADLKLPKRAVVIKKQFHSDRHNLNAYIVFEDKESAKKALAQNGTTLEGLTLRVDVATNSKKHNHNFSVFIGNLPFDIEEDPVREHFEDCGEIANVRLIRDRKIGIGKGFGYVLFKEKDAVELAVRLDGKELNGRKLRVQRSTSQPTPTDKTSKNTEGTTPRQPPRTGGPGSDAKPTKRPLGSDTPGSDLKKKKRPFPSNANTQDYQGIQAQRLQKFKKKQKFQKKKRAASNKDGDGKKVNKAKTKAEKFKKFSTNSKQFKKNKLDNVRKRLSKKAKKSGKS